MLAAKRLREVLDYNPDTGEFRWLETRSRFALKGTLAGTAMPNGRGVEYRRIRVDGHAYMLHRLAWLYMTGAWPTEIDHINRNPVDNRFVNLRETTHAQNCQNNGCERMDFRKDRNRWRARLQRDGKVFHLGHFETKEEAAEAVKAARAEHHGVSAVKAAEA